MGGVEKAEVEGRGNGGKEKELGVGMGRVGGTFLRNSSATTSSLE